MTLDLPNPKANPQEQQAPSGSGDKLTLLDLLRYAYAMDGAMRQARAAGKMPIEVVVDHIPRN